MNRKEYQSLNAEMGQLEGMFELIPAENEIDRYSIQERLKEIQQRISAYDVSDIEPARIRLTFSGQPVTDCKGILADFGAQAISRFTDAVAAIAASLETSLGTKGPIPYRDQNQLLITNTAVGSFGFELEENLDSRKQLALIEGPSAMEKSLSQIQSLMEGTLGTDDELTEQLIDMDQRAVTTVRNFLETLADNKATCALDFKNHVFRFSELAQVKRSVARLSIDNIQEKEVSLSGMFIGVLPKRRTFEFEVSDSKEVISGKVSGQIEDVSIIKEVLDTKVRINALEKKAGAGRPRYILLSLDLPSLFPE